MIQGLFRAGLELMQDFVRVCVRVGLGFTQGWFWGFSGVSLGSLEGLFVVDFALTHGFLDPPPGFQGVTDSLLFTLCSSIMFPCLLSWCALVTDFVLWGSRLGHLGGLTRVNHFDSAHVHVQVMYRCNDLYIYADVFVYVYVQVYVYMYVHIQTLWHI